MDPLPRFRETARHVADAIRTRPEGARWFIHCDTDADGISGAAVILTALRRIGRKYHVRSSRDKSERAYRELAMVEEEGVIIIDKGTSHADVIAEVAKATKRPMVIIDHHNLPADGIPDGIHILNPRMEGLDGSHDACSSTSALAVALALEERNSDLIPIALVGAIGDWQHMGGWQGWNKDLVERGLKEGHLERREQPSFIGMDLADALSRFKPEIPGLHGDVEAARDFLAKCGLPIDLDNESLTADQEEILLAAFRRHGVAGGMSETEMARFTHQDLVATRSGSGLRRMFRIVDACGREGKTGLGLRFLLGDKEAEEEALLLFGQYQKTISSDLERLRRQGTTRHKAFQEFAVERPAYTGMIAGIGMTHVASDKSRPMVVLANRDDGHVQISTRGDDAQVDSGLDLGRACLMAANRVKAEGGGHPIAAGAVVEMKDLQRFLSALDEELVAQGFLSADGEATS